MLARWLCSQRRQPPAGWQARALGISGEIEDQSAAIEAQSTCIDSLAGPFRLCSTCMQAVGRPYEVNALAAYIEYELSSKLTHWPGAWLLLLALSTSPDDSESLPVW